LAITKLLVFKLKFCTCGLALRGYYEMINLNELLRSPGTKAIQIGADAPSAVQLAMREACNALANQSKMPG
jgi:hypothetical protein